jgi:hypothetical protein
VLHFLCYVVGEIRCAVDADDIVAPVHISSSSSALVSRIGGSGSATFDFGSTTGSLWGLARCTAANSDSWIVNGEIWHIPHSSTFKWREYGPPPPDPIPGSTVISLVPRESLCEIQAIYLGDDGDQLLTGEISKTCDTSINRGYLCPSQMELAYPVKYDSTTNTITSIFGIPLAGSGSAVLEFPVWKSTFGDGNFWLQTECPTENSDSWFVNGDFWGVPQSNTLQWHNYGPISGNTITLTPREAGCRFRNAYLGRGTPSEAYVTLCPRDAGYCPSEAVEEGSLKGVLVDEVYGSCDNIANDPASPCAGSITFSFGSLRGDFWAYTKCPNTNSNSWFVNGVAWDVPVSSYYKWNKFGQVDSDDITLNVREANCRVRQVFRGHGTPFVKDCRESLEPLSDVCKPGVNCYHGTCVDNNSWCQCSVYAFGCQCLTLFSGVPATSDFCAFDAAIPNPPLFPVAKAVEMGYDITHVTLFYSHPRSLFKVVVNAQDAVVISNNLCQQVQFNTLRNLNLVHFYSQKVLDKFSLGFRECSRSCCRQ